MNSEKRRRLSADRDRTRPDAVVSGPATTRRTGWTARARYQFDLTLSRGPMVVIVYLGMATAAVIVVAATVIWLLGFRGVSGRGSIHDPARASWEVLTRVIDSGTFVADTSWPARLLGLVVTVTGIFLAGSLIGLISNSVDRRVENLRKGRSAVMEAGHTLVLGWSPRLPTILRELVVANESRRRSAFVVLAPRAKDDMEDELRRAVPDLRTTRLVCRTGDPGRPADLDMVAARAARSIIVLSDQDGDAGVVMATLALRTLDEDFSCLHVVAELDEKGCAETLHDLTEGRVATVRSRDIIPRISAQACRQPGLAWVLQELLDFDGDELYLTRFDQLAGQRYVDLQLGFDRSVVVGWRRSDGRLELNPPPTARYERGDELLTLSADDDEVVWTGPPPPAEPARGSLDGFVEGPHDVLVIGWSHLGPDLLQELIDHLPGGSRVHLVVEAAGDPTTDEPLAPALPAHLEASVRVDRFRGGISHLTEVLEDWYDEVVVVGTVDDHTLVEADATTMLTLLALGRRWPTSARRPRVVAEILDADNVGLAEATGADDFIVSDNLASLMLAQLSERIELAEVFDELFDGGGSSVSVVPAALVAPIGEEITFASLVTSAASRGLTALGWRTAERGSVTLNPSKRATVTFGPDDRVVVLGPREIADARAQATPLEAGAHG